MICKISKDIVLSEITCILIGAWDKSETSITNQASDQLVLTPSGFHAVGLSEALCLPELMSITRHNRQHNQHMSGITPRRVATQQGRDSANCTESRYDTATTHNVGPYLIAFVFGRIKAFYFASDPIRVIRHRVTCSLFPSRDRLQANKL